MNDAEDRALAFLKQGNSQTIAEIERGIAHLGPDNDPCTEKHADLVKVAVIPGFKRLFELSEMQYAQGCTGDGSTKKGALIIPNEAHQEEGGEMDLGNKLFNLRIKNVPPVDMVKMVMMVVVAILLLGIMYLFYMDRQDRIAERQALKGMMVK